jgi:hypothetical protein
MKKISLILISLVFFIGLNALVDYPEESIIKITSEDLRKINKEDYYQYTGKVAFLHKEVASEFPLTINESFKYQDKGIIEKITDIESEFESFQELRVEMITQDLSTIKTHIYFSEFNEICFNFKDKKCTGLNTLLTKKEIKKEEFSITGNTLLGAEMYEEFDIIFKFIEEEVLLTNKGFIETQKIEYQYQVINKTNEIVMQYGYYWLNPDIGVIRRQYTEFPVSDKRYLLIYDYILTDTNIW